MFSNYNDMVTIDEMCDMMHIGRNTAYELLRRGVLRGYKEGRVWKIPKFAVEDYIRERSTKTRG